MKIAKLVLFIIVITGFVFPVGEAGAVFLLIAPGASAQGTGEANVARVDDAYASYYNPASLAFQNKTSVVGMHVYDFLYEGLLTALYVLIIVLLLTFVFNDTASDEIDFDTPGPHYGD